jgi:hypothetical protein
MIICLIPWQCWDRCRDNLHSWLRI